MTYSDCEIERVTDVSNAVPELVDVRVNWSGVEDAPAQHVNQVLGQVGPPGTDGAVRLRRADPVPRNGRVTLGLLDAAGRALPVA